MSEPIPHEGIRSVRSDLSADGLLRCNWHSWTFDLNSGVTVVGGDTLRRLPVKVADGRVLLLIEPLDRAAERERALAGLRTRALDDADQQRIVHELARLERWGAAAAGVRSASTGPPSVWIRGQPTPSPALPDWLALFDAPGTTEDERVAALGEIAGHLADDGRRNAASPSPWAGERGMRKRSPSIEAQDEEGAVQLLRDAVTEHTPLSELAPILAAAALSHYADFGHSLIYTFKTLDLIERLGNDVTRPLLLLLARSLVRASREDLIPEFRSYPERLAAWGRRANANGRAFAVRRVRQERDAGRQRAYRSPGSGADLARARRFRGLESAASTNQRSSPSMRPCRYRLVA